MSLTATQVQNILFKTRSHRVRLKYKLPKPNSKWVPPKPKPKEEIRKPKESFSLFTFKITEQWNI